MKRLIFALVFAGGLAQASVTCNSVTGTLDGVVVQSDYTGCLTANTNLAPLLGQTNGVSDPAGLTVSPTAGSAFFTGNLEVEYQVGYAAAVVGAGGHPAFYTYTYTIDDTTNQISHFVLGLDGDSTTCKTINAPTTGPTSSCISNIAGVEANPKGGPAGVISGGGITAVTNTPASQQLGPTGFDTSPGMPSGANPNMPWNLYSLQVSPKTSGETEFTVQFTSAFAPVWQDIYIEDSNTSATSTDSAELFVAAPGSVITPPVPEPGFYGLVAIGMIGLFLVRRSGRKHSSTT